MSSCASTTTLKSTSQQSNTLYPPPNLHPPLSAGLTNTTPEFYEFLVPEVWKPLVSYSHLLKSWACHQALQLISDFPHAQHIYADFSYNPQFENLTGTAIALRLHSDA